MRERLSQPSCAGCSHLYYNDSKVPEIKKGVRLHPYMKYCLGAKRPRQFRGSDPKSKPPAWCPRRKTPIEFRIYGFKSDDEWLLHERLCRDLGRELSPSGYRYEVRHSQSINLSAYDFWKRLETESENDLLPIPVTLHEVIEFDDGLSQVFFYKTTKGFVITRFSHMGNSKK